MYCLELAGEEDAFAAREAQTAAVDVELAAPGVATATSIDRERVETLAYTHRANDLLGRCDADVASARALLTAASLDRDGSAAVRARDVRSEAGVSTSAAERELGSVLVERGFEIDLDDPDHELRVVFSDDACFVGWLVVESVRDYGTRRPTDRPFFQPGGMDPLDARAFANIAGARPGARILDPMCGTGGVLIEAGLVGAETLGVDAQEKMVRGARINLEEYLAGGFEIVRGDATRLPLASDSVDGVVFDAPYGRQSKIERHELGDLVAGALAESHRVAPRAVMVADRSWRDAARDAGWTVEQVFERRVHRSLVRYVHILKSDSERVSRGRPESATVSFGEECKGPHMSTIIGFECDDGAVIAGDRTQVRGGSIVSRSRDRVFTFDSCGTAVIGDDPDEFRRELDIELRTYRQEQGEPDVDAVARMVSTVAESVGGDVS